MRNDRIGDYIGTYNGGTFWVMDPRKEEVSILEIAYALSLNCRFNGHTDIFWSVAQHSLLVADIIENGLSKKLSSKEDLKKAILLGLLHDTSEGYISDIARPFKHTMKDYLAMEDKISRVIYNRIGFEYDEISQEVKDVVKEADNLALSIEALSLMNPCEEWITRCDTDNPLVQKWLADGAVKSQNPVYIESLLIREILRASQNLGLTTDFIPEQIAKEILAGIEKEESCIQIIQHGEITCTAKRNKTVTIIKKDDTVIPVPTNIFDSLQDIRSIYYFVD